MTKSLKILITGVAGFLGSHLAEKLANAWVKKDLIDVKSEDMPKNRKDSHLIQKQFHNILKSYIISKSFYIT